MNTSDFLREGREYVQTPPLKAALNLLDKEDIESHIVVAFKNGAEYALENQWISVKDKLPESQDIVMVATTNRCFMTAYYHGPKSGFITYGWNAYDKVGDIAYWMPIPELNIGNGDNM